MKWCHVVDESDGLPAAVQAMAHNMTPLVVQRRLALSNQPGRHGNGLRYSDSYIAVMCLLGS